MAAAASNIARVFAVLLITLIMVIPALQVTEDGERGSGGDQLLLRTPGAGSESPPPPPATEAVATDAPDNEAGAEGTRAVKSWQLMDTLEQEVWMPAGGWHHVGIDGEGLSLVPKELPDDAAGLSDASLKAIARAPEWLREDLADTLLKVSETNFEWFYWGMGDPSSPTEGDIDGDGDFDLVISNADYFPTVLENVGSAYEMRLVIMDESEVYTSPDTLYSPNWPSLGDIDSDGDADLVIGSDNGLFLWENIGSGGEILFDAENEVNLGITGVSDPRPELGDLDADGDLDLVVGDRDGSLTYFENTGMATSPSYTRRPLTLSTIAVPGESHPALGDMDGDGDLDLASGSDSGELYYFENLGSPSQAIWSLNDPTFFVNLETGERSKPCFVDLDGDRRVDILVGDQDLRVHKYMNIGTTTVAEWFIWSTYQIFEGIVYYTPDDNLKIIDPYWMDRYAGVIANAAQDRYVDEIAFSIAHMPVEVLRGNNSFPELYTENAEGVYSAGALVDYADVVDHGSYDTGDYYSTVKYWTKTEGGAAVEVEYPRDIYYWQIVHPKITDEDPTYIDPDVSSDSDSRGVAAPPDGKWWRTWLMEHADDSYPADPDNDGDGQPDLLYPRDENPPLLREKLEGIELLYDGVPYTTPRGYDNMGTNNTRDWGYRDHAVEVVSNWVEKTLPLNEQESQDGERPIQPVRIQATHNGNCGELADLTVAGARTALIPAENVGIMGEDHTWSEYWERGPRHWDNYWSDAGTLVDQENYYYENWGGRGKSGYTKNRADDYVYDVTTRYIPREHLSDVTFTVVDNNGDPVDGARVFVATWWAYESGYIPLPTPLPSIWNYTDAAGQCSFTLGDGNFTFHAVSKLGTDSIEKVYLDEGTEYEFQMELSAEMPYGETLMMEEELPTDVFGADFRVEVRMTTVEGRQFPPNPTSGNVHPQPITTALGVESFFVDEPGLSSFTGSQWFEGYDDRQGDITDNLTAYFTEEELEGGWYFAVNNKGALETQRRVRLEMALYGVEQEVPIARISSPPAGERVAAGDPVSIEGVASDNKGIASLSLSIAGPGTDETIDLMPYLAGLNWNYTWDTSGLGPGSFLLTLSAGDSDGNRAWHNISLTLFQDGAPLVEITHPSESDTFVAGEYVAVNATVTVAGNLTALDLYVDSAMVSSMLGSYDSGTGEATGEWDSLGYDPGDHLIEVRATDGQGYLGTAGVTVTLEDPGSEPPPRPDKEPPGLMILDPSDGEKFEKGDLVTFTGTATDDSAIEKLDLYIDSKRHGVLETLSANVWEYEWDSAGAKVGGHTARLEGTDEFGNEASVEVAFSIVEPTVPEDHRSPDVDIDSPSGTGTFDLGSTVEVEGTATDDIGVIRLEVRLDTEDSWKDITALLDDDGGFTYQWQTGGMDPGPYVLRFLATDAAGRDGTDKANIDLVDTQAPAIDDVMVVNLDEYATLFAELFGEEAEGLDGGVAIIVTASDNTDRLHLEYSLDGGKWKDAPSDDYWNPGAWSIGLTEDDLDPGEHTVDLRVSDMGGNTAEDSAGFTLEGGGDSGGKDDSSTPGFGGAALVLAVGAMSMLAASGRRRRRSE